VTKPGNSDPEEATTDKAPAPTEPTPEPEATAEPESATSEATGKPAEPAPAEEAPAEPEPVEAKAAEPADAEPEAKPAEAKPVRPAKARKAAADPEPLMAELEEAPPAPREEALRAKRRFGASPPPPEEALRDQAKRRFEEPAPRTLRYSFYFFAAAGLVWLASMVASLIFKQDIIDAQIKNNTNTKVTPEQIANAVTQILWIVTVASLAFTVLLGLFGYKATEGTRRARTLVTIFSAVMIAFHVLLNGTQPGILSAFLALIGLALLWSPSARKYFPPRQLS
jgi:hypothetical protein